MSAQFPQPGRRPQERRRWIKRATVVLPLLCFVIFGTIIGVRLAGNAIGANAASLVQLPGYVPGLIQKSSLVGSVDTNQSISISVGLRLRNIDSLKSFVDSASRPKSINAHRHLTPAEVAAAYAPLPSSQQAVIDYMQSYGFQTTTTMSQHLVVGFKGTIADAESAFHIQINNYRTSAGKNFYAPASNPSVPTDLAGIIQSIIGLDNTATFKHQPLRPVQHTQTIAASSNSSCPGPGNPQANPQHGYIPSQIASAYNLNPFYSAGFKGEGQSVAVFELDDYSQSDINAYTGCFGGGSVPIHRMKVDGGVPSLDYIGGSIEVELDMEMVLSADPHLAGLYVYEASVFDSNGVTPVHYVDEWAQIVNDAVPAVSTSWSMFGCESDTQQLDQPLFNQENNLFMLAAAQGQSIFAASGDDGTNDCAIQIGSTNPAPFISVDDPASQPYITAVGGTTLTLGGDLKTYSSETAWNNGLQTQNSEVWAGGGGISTIWPMPSWQQGPGVINSFSSNTPCHAAAGSYCREVPDVSLNADPFAGYEEYCATKASCGGTGWFPIGGTSAAAPMWAAFMALTNEKTLRDGGFNVGFINPYLYQIDQNAGGTSYANDFHDITTGNNDGLNDGGTTYPATANYDMATGLGSYNAWNLAGDLEKLANAKNGSRGAPANKTWYFAEGSVGGSFAEYLTILNPSATVANVTVQYLFQGGLAVSKPYSVPASSRFTISVNNELGIAPSGPHKSISAIVNSDVPVVVERPMYFNWNGIKAGTDVLGATSSTNTTFFFAQGAQGQIGSYHSTEFLTMLNPNSTPVNVTAKYFSGGQQVGTDTLTIPALQRGTIFPSHQGEAAIQLTSDQGIVAERPIYTSGTIPGISGSLTGAASAVGAINPGTDWLFAEGHTSGTFQENLVLANFGSSAATATVKLEYKGGSTETVQCTVNSDSQYYFNVNNPSANQGCSVTSPGTPTADVSAEVTANAPIVAERVMFFKYGSIPGNTDVVGEAGSSSQSVYSFAEGYTGGQFTEYLTLQNPTANAEVVAITLFADNMIIEKEVTLQPTSRTTILINDIINPIVNAYPASGSHNVSMVIQAFGGGAVIVERPMYFNYGGDLGGTDVIGYTGN